MRRIAWVAVVMAVLVVLALAGCQWAKFSEWHDGPRAAVTKGQPAATDGKYRFVPVGTGRWVDAAGKEHVEPVYVRVEGN